MNKAMEVEKIAILVRLEDGTVRQIVAKNEIKQLALNMISADGGLKVSMPMNDIEILDF